MVCRVLWTLSGRRVHWMWKGVDPYPIARGHPKLLSCPVTLKARILRFLVSIAGGITFYIDLLDPLHLIMTSGLWIGFFIASRITLRGGYSCRSGGYPISNTSVQRFSCLHTIGILYSFVELVGVEHWYCHIQLSGLDKNQAHPIP